MSDHPATLRLGLAAASLRIARRHPALRPTGKARILRPALRLDDTDGRAFAAAGWLCAGWQDNSSHRQETIAVAGAVSGPAPALGGEMDILAGGDAEIATVAVTHEGHVIEVQFHRLRLVRGDREEQAAEILLSAGPDDDAVLTGLAQQLCRDLPLFWTGVPALVPLAAALEIIEPPPLRAGSIPFDIDDDATAAAACQAIIRHCLMQFDGNIQPVLRDRDSEGVHQMRVALRRLRSALDIFSGLLPAEETAAVVEELRWLNEPLGRKRDLDVFIAETLAPLSRAITDAKGMKHLALVLDDRRSAAQAALVSALTSARCARLRLALDHLLDRLDDNGRQPAAGFAAAMLQKRRKKVKKLGREHDSLDIPALHRLRIRAKKLRYAAEFFRPLFARRDSKRFIAALSQLQDCLGALNDADVGSQLVRDVVGQPGSDPTAAAIIAWFAGRQQSQLDHLGDAWKAFDDIRPFWKAALKD